MRPATFASARPRAALARAGLVVCLAALAAAPAGAQPGAAAPTLPRPEEPRVSHTRAYVAMGVGAALTGASFFFASSADRAYAAYQDETDPARIEGHYDRARRDDRISAGLLVSGQAALALGLYWRFIRRPRSAPSAALDAGAPGAASTPTIELAPALSHGHAGVVLLARFR